MRTFIAIDLPDETKVQLVHVIQKLRRCSIHATWVQPDNLHITMKFLGDIDEALLPQIIQQLDDVARNEQSFIVALSHIGFLPPRGKPRVLCTATDQQRHLALLTRQLQRRLAPLGFPVEGRLTPHITLARLKSDKNLDQLKKLLATTTLNCSFTVTGLNLYRSTLHPDGARYDLLHQGCFQR